jgi:hypothetical protein
MASDTLPVPLPAVRVGVWLVTVPPEVFIVTATCETVPDRLPLDCVGRGVRVELGLLGDGRELVVGPHEVRERSVVALGAALDDGPPEDLARSGRVLGLLLGAELCAGRTTAHVRDVDALPAQSLEPGAGHQMMAGSRSIAS